MGLDITAYEKVTLVRALGVKQYNNDEEAQTRAEADDGTYLYQDGKRSQSDGMPDGVYTTSGASLGFCAGSYHGYNAWRDEMAKVVIGKSAEDVWRMCEMPITATKAEAERPLPFVELINFSDCEGFIGPKTSAKLAADFANYQEKVDAAGGDYFRAKYAEWRKAFTMASNGGAVRFH